MPVDYNELLNRGLSRIKETVGSGRFEMPEADVEIRGQKTIIRNFAIIADKFRREPQHLLKFLQKELATSGNIEGGQATFLGNILGSMVNRKINDYASEFVFCKECGQPDTKITHDDKTDMLTCWACGAKRQVKSLK